MRLSRTVFVALIALPAGIACLKEPAEEDTTPGAPTTPTDTGSGTATSGEATAGSTTAGSTTPGSTTSGSATSGSTTPGSTSGEATSGAGGGSGDGQGAGGAAPDTMGAGGAGGGAAPDTGAGGAGGGATAGADDLDPDTLIPGLDGLFWAFRTTNPEDPGDFKYLLTEPGAECPTGDSWATSGITVSKEFQVMGTPGQEYTVEFELRGALGLRCYADGTPSGMTADPAGINQAFYVGGQQFGDSFLNTIELAVTGATTTSYFLNGIPSTSDMCDTEITYDVQYKASFVIQGDSAITLSTHASDCHALQNCGADPAGAGCVPRIIDVSGVQVKASPMQPIFDYLGGAEFYPQWLVFDIQSITTP